MKHKKIAVLTSPGSWFIPHSKNFVTLLNKKKYQAKLFHHHEKISKNYQTVFILSYYKIIESRYLDKHQHNLVVHASNLPQGKGWSPLFWQVLERKNSIPIVLFEATRELDAGVIYLKDKIKLKGHELNDEIRVAQVVASNKLCLNFLKNYKIIRGKAQQGNSSFYSRRRPANSRLDVTKSIADQFNLLRIVNNESFPAFFEIKGQKYKLKIEKVTK